MDVNHYQNHLNRVSRSFAFCIARLEGDLRGWVGLSYLLCRILDTVEDASWSSLEKKNLAFAQFERFLFEGAEAADAALWAASFPGIPEGERILLEDSARIFQDLQNLPLSVKEIGRAHV